MPCARAGQWVGMHRRLLALTVFLSVHAAACSDRSAPDRDAPSSDEGTHTTDPEPAGEDAGVSDDVDDHPPDGDASAPPPPCDDERTKALQAALDGVVGSKGTAIAAIKAPCGTRVLTSGPTKTAATDVHMMGSVTKTLVSSAVLKLVEDGKLSLDDSVSRWIPDVPGGDAVRVRHLLQHTSGLAEFTGPGWFLQYTTNHSFTPQELLSQGFSKGSQSAPGTKFLYANTNYVALGLIVEKVSGQWLQDFIRARLLEPLGLETISFSASEPIRGKLVGKGANFSGLWGAGDAVTTAKDLATWIEARATGNVHGATMTAEMHESAGVDVGSDMDYGLGEMTLGPSHTDGGGDRAYGHDGLVPFTYLADAFHFPQRETTVVVLLDYVPADPSKYHDAYHAVCRTLFQGL